MKSTTATRKSKSKNRPQRPPMTAEQAQTFERISVGNATRLMHAAAERGCGCSPYADWYTFRRWKAQGMSVKKGEKATRLPLIVTDGIAENVESSEEPRQHFATACVFCRCQVQPSKESAE